MQCTCDAVVQLFFHIICQTVSILEIPSLSSALHPYTLSFKFNIFLINVILGYMCSILPYPIVYALLFAYIITLGINSQKRKEKRRSDFHNHEGILQIACKEAELFLFLVFVLHKALHGSDG